MSGFGLTDNRFVEYVEHLEEVHRCDIDGDEYIGARKIPRARVVRRPRAQEAPKPSPCVFDPATVIPGALPRSGANVRCLFIGINYFGTSAELSGCLNDVKLMQEVLLCKLKFPATEVRVLVDDEKFAGGFDGLPTRQNIIDGFRWLVRDSKPGDAYYLHFSGHGTEVEDTSGDEESGFDQAIVPSDYETAGVIIDDDLYAILFDEQHGMHRGAYMTATVDCCNSGSILDLPYNFLATPDQCKELVKCKKESKSGLIGMVGKVGKFFLRRHKEEEAERLGEVHMLAGCKDDQQSADVHDTSAFKHPTSAQKSQSGGACTNAFAEILLKQSAPISFGDLIVQMEEMLEARGFTQVPQWASSHRLNADQLFSLYPQQ